jgi:hypothetical protein
MLAWFVRRTYYLLQMPGWGRRLRIVIDWTFALLFRPDIVNISLDSEAALLLREAAAGGVVGKPPDGGSPGIQLNNGHRADSKEAGGTHRATGGGV